MQCFLGSDRETTSLHRTGGRLQESEVVRSTSKCTILTPKHHPPLTMPNSALPQGLIQPLYPGLLKASGRSNTGCRLQCAFRVNLQPGDNIAMLMPTHLLLIPPHPSKPLFHTDVHLQDASAIDQHLPILLWNLRLRHPQRIPSTRDNKVKKKEKENKRKEKEGDTHIIDASIRGIRHRKP